MPGGLNLSGLFGGEEEYGVLILLIPGNILNWANKNLQEVSNTGGLADCTGELFLRLMRLRIE